MVKCEPRNWTCRPYAFTDDEMHFPMIGKCFTIMIGSAKKSISGFFAFTKL